MLPISRRAFLQISAAIALEAFCAPAFSQTTSPSANQYVTSFYQFNADAIRRLGQKNALPNGPRFLHLFVQSTPGSRAFPDLTRQVHNAGESFKFGWAYDAHKHDWQNASDDDLKRWAMDFREAGLSSAAPPDYFAFNEMPPAGRTDPEVRARIVKLLRHLHEGAGGPKWPGLFYFIEPDSNIHEWRGDTTEFFETIDQTCDFAVAEHFHSDAFVFSRTLPQLSDHLFALARWMLDSGKPAQINIAQHKYMPLHSSYWSRGYRPWTALYRDIKRLKFDMNPQDYQAGRLTPWQGMISDEHEVGDLEKFFRRCIAATRMNELGKNRISFGPLAITPALGPAMLPLLARALGEDAAKFVSGEPS